MTPSSLADRRQCFGETYYFHPQGKRTLLSSLIVAKTANHAFQYRQANQTSYLKPTECFNHKRVLQFVGTDVKQSKERIET